MPCAAAHAGVRSLDARGRDSGLPGLRLELDLHCQGAVHLGQHRALPHLQPLPQARRGLAGGAVGAGERVGGRMGRQGRPGRLRRRDQTVLGGRARLRTRPRLSRPVLALTALGSCRCALSTCGLVVRPHGSPTELVKKVAISSKGDPGNGQSVEKVVVLFTGRLAHGRLTRPASPEVPPYTSSSIVTEHPSQMPAGTGLSKAWERGAMFSPSNQ